MSYIYLGKKGGGSLLALQVLLETLESSPLVILSENNDELANYPNNVEILKLNIPRNIWGYLNIFNIFSVLLKVRSRLFAKQIDKVFFIMPHPLDILINLIIKRKISSYHLIHDFPTHPKEVFPGPFYTKLIAKFASRIVTLSNFVADGIQNEFDLDPIRISFPSYEKSAILKYESSDVFEQKIGVLSKVILVGRDSAYKGVDLGLSALKKSKLIGSVIIAGDMAREALQGININVHKGWLDRKEIENLIIDSDILLLPYTSATQSGLIPIAIYYKKWIVATDVGGLKEQLANYPYCVIAEHATVESLSAALTSLVDRSQTNISEMPIAFNWSRDFELKLLS
jgi:glycosyltransferase involved in cell wall biosynthesis